MSDITVLSLGGSIAVPDHIDADFIKNFVGVLRDIVKESPRRKFVVVVGGGKTARRYQQAARDVAESEDPDALDQIGIASTHLNAQVMRAACGPLCKDQVFINPTKIVDIAGSILIGGGWKPGFSTDAVAVYAAERLGAMQLINLSNIAQVYTADPKVDRDAKPLERLRWPEMLEIVGTEWIPGKNTPLDPTAAKRSAEIGLAVIVADGRDMDNLRRILTGQQFVGTTISGN
ncbi:MAG: UMP kinase [Spirochaetales bacterium]